MPVDADRFRVKTTESGKKVRLAFKDNKVVEAKNLKTGATHTPSAFRRDRMRRGNRTLGSFHRPRT